MVIEQIMKYNIKICYKKTSMHKGMLVSLYIKEKNYFIKFLLHVNMISSVGTQRLAKN